MLSKRIAVAAVGAATAVSGTFVAAQAQASEYCPTSVNGAGSIIKTQHLDMLSGESAPVTVLNDESASLVCMIDGTKVGLWDEGDTTEEWYVEATPGVSGSDSIRVGATDGDKYYTGDITATLTKVTLPKPVVTTKRLTNKKGKVTRNAKVKITNTSTHTETFYGSYTGDDLSFVRTLAPGASTVLSLSRYGFYYEADVTNEASGNDAYIQSGYVNNKTGKVSVDDVTETFGSSASKSSARQAPVKVAKASSLRKSWAH